jgi:hypothetical protein
MFALAAVAANQPERRKRTHKVAKPVYEAHPEWFFRKASGVQRTLCDVRQRPLLSRASNEDPR